ncbi:MAG: GGDEF domain-containing protein [Endomicrobia bacterium]|nr:GGDEF domain-containing protein [Endomicrobiia bacterium]
MNNKIFPSLVIAAVLGALGYFIPKGIGTIVLSYFIMLSGLYYGRWIKESVIVGSLLASFVIFNHMNEYPFACIASIIFFISVIPIPYYFIYKTEKEEKELSAKNSKLKEKYTDILAEHSFALEERQKYEDNIERIMQLYIIGRDLSKNVFIEDYTETILRAITRRAGVVSVSMFKRGKGEWMPLAFSKPYQKNDWVKYMSDNKQLANERRYAVVNSSSFCTFQESVVFWPLKIENELLGCMLIVVERAYASRYVEEGSIFGPQISLGAKRANLFAEVSERSRNDGLTGLYLKRYFMERLQSELQREKRYSGGFFIIMLDIDHFKDVNDKYGHLAGDKVLCAIARILTDCARPGDLICRYGGEEFTIFMSMATKYEARSVAQEINTMVNNKKFHENGETFSVTISAGISCYPKGGKTVHEIINAADKALYKAKNDGRNRVVLFTECGVSS